MALPDGKTWMNSAEVAKTLGVSTSRVRQLGLLGTKKGGLTRYYAAPTALVFDADEVKKLAKQPRKTGRPRGGFKKN